MLVSALQKGLSQTPAVRLIIYSGLYEAVARNPELCSDVLAVLHEHAVDMGWAELRRTEDGGGLVDLDPLIEEENAGVVIKVTLLLQCRNLFFHLLRRTIMSYPGNMQDPAGWYFHCAQQLLTKSEELYGGGAEDMDIDGYVEDENATRTRNWLSSLLEEMCRRYSEADLTDLNFDKTADYSKATVVGSKNVWKADLVKNLLEALMDYLVMHGADVDEDKARKFVGLFKRHQEVSALLKVSCKDQYHFMGFFFATKVSFWRREQTALLRLLLEAGKRRRRRRMTKAPTIPARATTMPRQQG